MKTAPMTKHQRIKDLSNKAEGIFHYIGPNDLLFRLISTGNQLASEVNHSVAFLPTLPKAASCPALQAVAVSTRFTGWLAP